MHLVLSTLISFDDEQKLRSLSLYDFLHFLFARDVRTFSSLVFVTNVNHCWIEGPSFTRQQEEETILWSENFAFLVFCFFFFFFLFSSSSSSFLRLFLHVRCGLVLRFFHLLPLVFIFSSTFVFFYISSLFPKLFFVFSTVFHRKLGFSASERSIHATCGTIVL